MHIICLIKDCQILLSVSQKQNGFGLKYSVAGPVGTPQVFRDLLTQRSQTQTSRGSIYLLCSLDLEQTA